MKSIEGDYQKTKSAEELAGLLYRDERSGRYYHTTAGSVPAEFRVNFKTTSTSGTSDDWEAVGDFHTHPPRTGMDQEGFSIVDNDDLRVKQDEGKYGKSYRKYVRTPRGDIRVLENAETTIRNSTGKVPGRSICPNAQPCLPKHAAGAT